MTTEDAIRDMLRDAERDVERARERVEYLRGEEAARYLTATELLQHVAKETLRLEVARARHEALNEVFEAVLREAGKYKREE